MSALQIKGVVIFVILVINSSRSSTQSLSVDSSASLAVKNAVTFYNTVFTEQLHLYNGKEYVDYPQAFDEGQPYFLHDGWNKGTVNYNGNTYTNVSLKYDLVSDDLVILAFNKVSKIRLVKENVARFTLAEHSFIHIIGDSLRTGNMDPGFYHVIADGRVALLARRTKNIQTYLKETVELKVFNKEHYYLKKNSAYFPVNTKNDLFDQLGDKKKELQKYIKQNKLRFRKDVGNSIAKVIMHYNQITQ